MYPLPTSSEVPLSGSTDRLPPLPHFEEDERLIIIVSELSLLVLRKCGLSLMLIEV